MTKIRRTLAAAGIVAASTALSLGNAQPAHAAAYPVGDYSTESACIDAGWARYGDPDWGSGIYWHCWQTDQDGVTWTLWADEPFQALPR